MQRNGSSGGRSNSFSSSQPRNHFRPALSAEKLLDKYNLLAKEALATGDKTLSENYLQHADHFLRVIEDKNKNRNENKVNLINNSPKEENSIIEESKSKESTQSKENS